jgi:predicted amidohydrolase
MKRRNFIRNATAAGIGAAFSARPAAADVDLEEIFDEDLGSKPPGRTARIACLNSTTTSPGEDCNPVTNSKYKEALRTRFYESRVKYHEEIFEEAGRRGYDLICASEDLTRLAGARAVFSDSAEEVTGSLVDPVPGPLSKRFGKIARRHSMYIAAPYMVRGDDGNIYNSVVLIDRAGDVQGVYRKTHPVRNELEYVTPGDVYPVFDTDFGRIAFMICWDMMYPEVPQIYALKGVDMILWPTAAIGWDADIGLATLRVRASDHSIYFGASAYNRPHSAHSCIVDHNGDIMIDVGYQKDALAGAEIDFSKKREENIEERVLRDRRQHTYGLITDPNPPIENIS